MTARDQLPGSWRRVGIVIGLGVSAVLLGAAPALLPDSYNWILHTTSESAAQGVAGAWMARLGFLLFGLSVLWLARAASDRWGRWGTLALGLFGVMMVAAAFSHKPWESGIPFDETEDLLHSITATVMGFAFALGVVAVGIRRPIPAGWHRVLDSIALVAAMAIPLAMSQSASHAGVLQRLMFLTAYGWYTAEALAGDSVSSAQPAGART